MVTKDMLDSVARFIDSVTSRIEKGVGITSESVAATAGLCATIVEYRLDNLADNEINLIVDSAARIVERDLAEAKDARRNGGED